MPDEIKIELSPEAAETLRRMQTLPEWAMKAIADGMKLANQETVSHVQEERLTGQGPFDPDEHRLGIRTGRLRSALWAAEPTVNGALIDSSIGDNVVYAAIHEFGGKITRRPYSGSVRLRTDRVGNLIRAKRNQAVFASKAHKLAKTVQFQSKGYEINMPERAPVRTGIAERIDRYGETVSEKLLEAWASK